jgi:3-deoxy-7-phosphoheptulonate synthase
MMLVMKSGSSAQEVQQVVNLIKSWGLDAHLSTGEERTVIGVVGDTRKVQRELFLHNSAIEQIIPISRPYKLASREFIPSNSTFPLDGFEMGGQGVVVIAGPCSVESRSQLLETAQAVLEAGAHALRGGAYKPRTSPYAFQGLGEEGLEILAEARELTGLPVVTEVMSPEMVPLVARFADVLQVGARNMQNYSLLHAVGESQKPVLLKRGMSATIEELLMAAEYILSHGNRRVILCERGIRTFETATRNTTDINAIPVLKHLTHLPVIIDPSHSTGDWKFVSAVARAGVAAGADGVIVEVHPRPEEALSDGGQSLKPKHFVELVAQIRAIAAAVDRRMAPSKADGRP